MSLFFYLYKNSLSINKHRRNEKLILTWALSIVNSMERDHSRIKDVAIADVADPALQMPGTIRLVGRENF